MAWRSSAIQSARSSRSRTPATATSTPSNTSSARFEYHPEDRANVVALGLLGSQIQRPVPLPEVVAIKVAAGAVRETIPPDRTVLLPAGADDIVVTMRFSQPIDPQAMRATVVQAAVPARWQLEVLSP